MFVRIRNHAFSWDEVTSFNVLLDVLKFYTKDKSIVYEVKYKSEDLAVEAMDEVWRKIKGGEDFEVETGVTYCSSCKRDMKNDPGVRKNDPSLRDFSKKMNLSREEERSIDRYLNPENVIHEECLKYNITRVRQYNSY